MFSPLISTRTQPIPYPPKSPFCLQDNGSYQAWRDRKLAGYPDTIDQLLVEVSTLDALSPAELEALKSVCRQTNMVLYQQSNERPVTAQTIRTLGAQLGLTRLDHNLCTEDDGIAVLAVVDKGRRQEYIPYTNRPINWHTDGYYNPVQEQVRAFTMHCTSPAAEGGANKLLDPEIVYILLREQNPDHIQALMVEDAMTIPANIENGTEIRPCQSGPVFSVDADTGRLHMRYTARTRSIAWRQDPDTRAAVTALETVLAGDCPYIFHHRLEAGQGLVCNNVLHRREAFVDNPEAGVRRQLYRARYHDCINGTWDPSRQESWPCCT